MSSSRMPRRVAFWRSSRITTASPCSIGITETRMSTSASSIRILMRPSCGSRFSAMFRWLRILTRDTMAGWNRLICAGTGTSCSTPSIRYRMRNSSSNGSR